VNERDELVDQQIKDRLADAGWNLNGYTWNPDGTVKVGLRRAPDTSGNPVRYISGSDINDAIRKELERLAAEGTTGEA
jgi:hypothetical protein